ncbi:carbohydrate ABC transporter permease [Rhizobium sp. P44RR-XXIV]|uniref:carbohydrate ABC transporter permease n=1 Tax=Rhizobium sp. P44RR-XXIV TaxID=1921145 RepID=UPI00098440C9|nr:carbohydrate ABC transporter permease [Rhizobium sp. P44RR-XXIV]TIX87359.1 carbohydrate ABC transporter permease [Rhizobium sp. P44RR-XXIV]
MKRLAKTIALTLLKIVVVFYTVFPFYWAIVSSFKSGSALFSVDFFPAIDLTNYRDLLTNGNFLRNILNSAIVAVSVVTLSLIFAITSAYALGKLKFRGRGVVLAGILGASMFPQIVVLSGLFGTIRWLGLYNSLGSLVLSYMIFSLPFTVWVMTSFIRQIPAELEDAARMDGCSTWAMIWQIYFPLLAPALASTGLLAFIASWNEFLFALTFTLSDTVRTVPVGLGLISGSSRFELPFGTIMAASVIVTVPLILLVLIFQRRIVSGLTAGAVK